MTEEISIEEISQRTGITLEDTLHTLTAMQMLKYYKGGHIICITEKHREGAHIPRRLNTLVETHANASGVACPGERSLSCCRLPQEHGKAKGADRPQVSGLEAASVQQRTAALRVEFLVYDDDHVSVQRVTRCQKGRC